MGDTQHDSTQWLTLNRREVFSAPPWLRVWQEEIRLPSGRLVPDFYQVQLPEFVVVVAQTPEGEIVTERQYKHGVRRTSTALPAGYLIEGEEPLACARRELLEETGYSADTWHRLGSFVVDGNRGCGRVHVFVAQNARRISDPYHDELEPLEVGLMRPQALVWAALSGDVVMLASMAALMLAVGSGLLHDRG